MSFRVLEFLSPSFKEHNHSPEHNLVDVIRGVLRVEYRSRVALIAHIFANFALAVSRESKVLFFSRDARQPVTGWRKGGHWRWSRGRTHTVMGKSAQGRDWREGEGKEGKKRLNTSRK